MKKEIEALKILEETIKELESPKCRVSIAVQKLMRASKILNIIFIENWCRIQLGDKELTIPLSNFIKELLAAKTEEERSKRIKEIRKKMKELNLDFKMHFSIEELNFKSNESSGGYENIGFIEEKYADLVRIKSGNDNTYYKTNLISHISYVKKRTHDLATEIYNQLAFKGTVSSSFDVLRNAVDDKLLDLNPEIAEQLMISFKAISTDNAESWSHALASCRRILESIADELQPVIKDEQNGRKLGQSQYINRLWKFMDDSIKSETNKQLAKSHVDYLGIWLESINKITNKGVHSDIEHLEAVKAVFHTYLVICDILNYLKKDKKVNKKKDINNASIDELEAILGINRNLAKNIFKMKIENGSLNKEIIKNINGVGPKLLSKILDRFIVE